MLTRIGTWARDLAAADPATSVYGAGRTLIALGTLGTLLFSRMDSVYRPAVGEPVAPLCTGISRATLFCLAGAEHLEVARWIAVALLAVVVSGWRPRFTGVAHWWVAWSFFLTGTLTDGGDQVAAILTLLLIPITLADGRRWHWQAAEPGVAAASGGGAELARLLAWSCLWMVRLQMAGIYFHAASGKMLVKEWHNGTAVYYWFTDPNFGVPEYLRPLVMPVVVTALGVTVMTWGPMLLETLLFAGLLMDRRYWTPLLVSGILFHGAIALVHGLPSFSLVMWGGLVLYLRPPEKEFSFAWVRRLSPARQWRRLAPVRVLEPVGEPRPAIT